MAFFSGLKRWQCDRVRSGFSGVWGNTVHPFLLISIVRGLVCGVVVWEKDIFHFPLSVYDCRLLADASEFVVVPFTIMYTRIIQCQGWMWLIAVWLIMKVGVPLFELSHMFIKNSFLLLLTVPSLYMFLRCFF
jgi:hypothetical protein